MFRFIECFFNFSIVVLRTKSNRCLQETMAVFLNFVVKTAKVWLVFGGFFCVFGQSETICILHSCNKFAPVLQKNCTPFSANQNWVIFSCILLKAKVLHFKIENTPIKEKNGKKNFKKCLDSFLWTNESFSPWNCVSRNSTLFSSRRIRALGLFWTNRRSEVSEEMC